MPSYQYTARDERGHAVNGTLAAPSPESLADQLKRMGYVVTRSQPLGEEATVEAWLLKRFRRVGSDDLVLFNVQLSKMIQVGIPLVTALETLGQQTEHPTLRAVISDVAHEVEGGTSLSEALGRHRRVFSELFINMVRAGEVSGKLDEILRRLAVFAKREAALHQQVTTAMTYPMLLLVVGMGAAAFLILGIIPKFMKVFLDAHVPLPLPTLLLYQASQLLLRYWWLMLAAVAGISAAAQQYVRTPQGRRQFDVALLKLPVLGDLVRKAALSQVARTLETLFSSGVPVLESLSIAADTCRNVVIAEVCRTAQASVRQGGAISDALRVSREFPPMVVQMITVGEASGTMDHMLAEIAEHYDELVQHTLKRLTTLIEPVFLIGMGGVVSFIMASVLLPLFRMVNVVH